MAFNEYINKFNEENKNKNIKEEEKSELKNHMILLYVTDNESDSLLSSISTI